MRVHVSGPHKQDLKTLWLRDPAAQRHAATSERIFEGTQSVTKERCLLQILYL